MQHKFKILSFLITSAVFVWYVNSEETISSGSAIATNTTSAEKSENKKSVSTSNPFLLNPDTDEIRQSYNLDNNNSELADNETSTTRIGSLDQGQSNDINDPGDINNSGAVDNFITYVFSGSNNLQSTGGIAARSFGATNSNNNNQNNNAAQLNDDAIDPGNADEVADTHQDVITEQPWPTPNCPPELEQGSTETDARQMQQAYGCRYLKYERMLNDGTKNFRAWWGFYSAS